MPKNLTLLAAFFPLLTLQAQVPCGFDLLQQQTLQHPEHRHKQQLLEQEVYDFFKNQPAQADFGSTAPVVIPTVVHIIHDNGPENISDAQVQQAIQWLNQALSNSGPYNQGSGANTEIQLCLARRTPDGAVTQGITRNQSPLTVIPDVLSNDVALKNLNRWAPKDYLNIWVVRSICTNSSGCNITAYAYSPTYHGSNLDGIVIEADFFGSTPGNIAALAHEVGHYFGLYHTFEGGCKNDDCLLNGDRICDTPPDQSTAAVPCGQTVNTCTTDTQSGFSTDQPDMSWNFMDYGKYDCMHDFTAGQAARMQFIANGVRKSLLTSKSCQPPCPTSVTAAFTTDTTTVLVGTNVLFNNQSQQFASLQWTVNGVPFSTGTNPSYVFNELGTFTVGLLAQPADTVLCASASATVVIRVVCSVLPNFFVSQPFPKVNEIVQITNTSQQATAYAWFLNGQSLGSVLDSISFSAPGTYELELRASNGACTATRKITFQVQLNCPDRTFALEYDPDFLYFPLLGEQSVAVLKDGNILVTGNMRIGGLASEDPLKASLVKMRPNGDIIWSRALGKDSLNQHWSIVKTVPTSDGGYVALGLGVTITGANPTTISNYPIVIKFSSSGLITWARALPEIPIIDNYSLIQLAGGSIVLSTQNSLITLDQNGQLKWAKFYFSSSPITVLAAHPDGGLLAGGQTPGHIWHIDQDGNMLWSSIYTDFSFSDIALTESGDIVAVGFTNNTPPNNLAQHGIALRLDAGGQLKWAKRYFKNPISFQFIDALHISPTGAITLGVHSRDLTGGGNASNYLRLIGINDDGDVSWVKKYTLGLQDQGARSMDLTGLPNGSLFASNKTTDNSWLLKTDAIGRAGDCGTDLFDQQVQSLSPSPLSLAPIDSAFTPLLQDTFFSLHNYPVPRKFICPAVCSDIYEICDNNIDDDGDGLFDCLDPDCDCPKALCQTKQANTWYFGKNSGLDFSTDPPTVLTDGQTNALLGAAVANDVKGNLLFYSDGKTVYNRFHQAMPNGQLLSNGNILHLESLILKLPDSAAIFYLFTLATELSNGTTSAYYSVIDMRLNQGRGDVVAGKKLLNLLPPGASALPRLAAFESCLPGNSRLIIQCRLPEPGFFAFLLNKNGLDPMPQFTATGPEPLANTSGQMKLSPNGRMLATTNQFSKTVRLYRFNPYQSGYINPMPQFTMSFPHPPVGLEFSPDGHFLYVSIWDEAPATFHSEIIQFDLWNTSGADLTSAGVRVAVFTSTPPNALLGAMQLGPDGKIYVSTSTFVTNFNTNLHVIHQPRQAGPACEFQENALSLAPTSGANAGLCNFPANLFASPEIVFPENSRDTFCSNTVASFDIPSESCYNPIHWTLEGLSSPLVILGDYGVSFLNISPGSGRVIATSTTPCGVFSDTLDIVVLDKPTLVLDLGPDRTVCDNGVYTFEATPGFERYRWQNGATDSVFTTLFPGKYWVDVWDYCGNQQSDTITVSIAPATILDLGADPTQCPETSTTFTRPAIFAHWQWLPNDAFLSCDTCAQVTVSPQVSTGYQVIAQTADGCISVDSITFQIRDTLPLVLDTFACEGTRIEVFGASLPADTTGQFFFPASGAGQCDTLWTVHVLGEMLPSSTLDTLICPEAQLEYRGVLLSPGSQTEFAIPRPTGCDSLVTVVVTALPALTLSLPPDTILGLGAALPLLASVSGEAPFGYLWTPASTLSCTDCPNPVASPETSTWYTLQVSDANACQQSDSMLVTIDSTCRWLPVNAFTPDGDGYNDWFYPNTSPCVALVQRFQIFNRWGQVVFERQNFPPNQENLGWDGRDSPTDVYIWLAELEYFDGKKAVLKGEITLLR